MVRKLLIFSFGRYNPVHLGHMTVFDAQAQAYAREKRNPTYKGNVIARVYTSHVQDAKKNPLDFNTKVGFLQTAMPPGIEVSKDPKIRSPFDVFGNAWREGFTDLIMVAGEDRVDEYEKHFFHYNQHPEKFGAPADRIPLYQSIKIEMSGTRNIAMGKIAGMSATKMRAAAQAGDLNTFKDGLPDRLKPKAKAVFDAVRKGMNLHEAHMSLTEKLLSALNEDTYTPGEVARAKREHAIKEHGGRMPDFQLLAGGQPDEWYCNDCGEVVTPYDAKGQKLPSRGKIPAGNVLHRWITGGRPQRPRGYSGAYWGESVSAIRKSLMAEAESKPGMSKEPTQAELVKRRQGDEQRTLKQRQFRELQKAKMDDFEKKQQDAERVANEKERRASAGLKEATVGGYNAICHACDDRNQIPMSVIRAHGGVNSDSIPCPTCKRNGFLELEDVYLTEAQGYFDKPRYMVVIDQGTATEKYLTYNHVAVRDLSLAAQWSHPAMATAAADWARGKFGIKAVKVVKLNAGQRKLYEETTVKTLISKNGKTVRIYKDEDGLWVTHPDSPGSSYPADNRADADRLAQRFIDRLDKKVVYERNMRLTEIIKGFVSLNEALSADALEAKSRQAGWTLERWQKDFKKAFPTGKVPSNLFTINDYGRQWRVNGKTYYLVGLDVRPNNWEWIVAQDAETGAFINVTSSFVTRLKG